MEYRCSSRAIYEMGSDHPDIDYEKRAGNEVTGWLSFRRTKEPILTAELDENSFFLAFSDWGSFVEHSLGAYAKAHPNIVATIYTYSTGQSPSVNPSDGEHHKKYGWHNACFIGVVGRDSEEILDLIAAALEYQFGVPKDLIERRLKDRTKTDQINVRNPSEYLPSNQLGSPKWHVEAGRCWAPETAALWYTHEHWLT